VILLDEDAHMEQRKLMLPAFHGERIERLSSLVAGVAEREVAGWPDEAPVELHPRLQRLTLEVVLRAVFGLDPGARLDALRERLSAMLSFWIPFGGGRRRCLGASFAMLEMKLVLRALLTARRLRTVADPLEPPRRRNITIKPGQNAVARLPRREPPRVPATTEPAAAPSRPLSGVSD
jgi:cytochrome P450